MRTLTDEAQFILSTITRVGALISLTGSGWIVIHILQNPELRKRVYHRLLLGMTLFEVTDSIFHFLLQWCVPANESEWLGARGTRTTCQMQGFFFQLSIVSILYNAHLSLYCLLTVRYNWSERQMARYVEPWMHLSAIIFGLATGAAGIPLTLYNSLNATCGISYWPPGCQQSYNSPTGETDCERGDNAFWYSLFFFEIWAFATFLTTIILMGMVYWRLQHQETRNLRYRFERSNNVHAGSVVVQNTNPNRRVDGSVGAGAATATPAATTATQRRTRNSYVTTGGRSNHGHGNSRRFAFQYLLYVLALWISHIFARVQLIYYYITGEYVLGLAILTMIFVPLEGFFNFLVYIRPRYNRVRKENPNESVWFVLQQVLFRKDLPAGRGGRSRRRPTSRLSAITSFSNPTSRWFQSRYRSSTTSSYVTNNPTTTEIIHHDVVAAEANEKQIVTFQYDKDKNEDVDLTKTKRKLSSIIQHNNGKRALSVIMDGGSDEHEVMEETTVTIDDTSFTEKGKDGQVKGQPAQMQEASIVRRSVSPESLPPTGDTTDYHEEGNGDHTDDEDVGGNGQDDNDDVLNDACNLDEY